MFHRLKLPKLTYAATGGSAEGGRPVSACCAQPHAITRLIGPKNAFFPSGNVGTTPPRSITSIYNSTTAGKAQRPKHPPTFTHHRRQGHRGQVTFACHIARLQSGKRLGNGHPASTGHPCQPAPLDPPAPCEANQNPGSALGRGTAAGGDSRASHPDRSVHCLKTTRVVQCTAERLTPASPCWAAFYGFWVSS